MFDRSSTISLPLTLSPLMSKIGDKKKWKGEGRKFAATCIVESTLFPASAVEYFIIVINTVQMRRGFKRGVINEIKYRHFRR